MSIETIVRAAIMIDGGVWSVPPPGRHPHAMWLYSYGSAEQPSEDASEVPPRAGTRPVRGRDQGFLTSTGRFVSREEAWGIAVASGQIIRRVGGQPDYAIDEVGTKLYSENLW